MGNRAIRIGLGAIGLAAIAAVGIVRGDVAGLYAYAFDGRHYPGIKLAERTVIVGQGAARAMLIEAASSTDHRRPWPDFSATPPAAVAPFAHPGEAEAYRAFLDDVTAALMGVAPGSDDGADRIMARVHRAWKAKEHARRQIDDGVMDGKKSPAEDFVFYLVNAQSACGTVAEATVALLRNAGYRARMVQISHAPTPLQASHVALEYYSADQGKWVLMDPMIAYIPRRPDGTRLSAIETFDDPAARAEGNRRWTPEPHYAETNTLIIDRLGPVATQFLYSASDQTRAALAE